MARNDGCNWTSSHLSSPQFSVPFAITDPSPPLFFLLHQVQLFLPFIFSNIFLLFFSFHAHHHALCVYPQDKRVSCARALSHPYLEEGRLRYHSCMCSCCHSSIRSSRNKFPYQYPNLDYEPVASHAFDDSFERDLTSVHQVKGKHKAAYCIHHRHPTSDDKYSMTRFHRILF